MRANIAISDALENFNEARIVRNDFKKEIQYRKRKKIFLSKTMVYIE